MMKSNLTKLIESSSVVVLTFIFGFQSCFAQVAATQQNPKTSISVRQIVDIYNQFETPEQIKKFIGVYVGESQATALGQLFKHNQVSMNQKLTKLASKGNEVQVASTGEILMKISASSSSGSLNQIQIGGDILKVSSPENFETQLHSLDRMFNKEKTSRSITSHLDSLFISQAYADGVPQDRSVGVAANLGCVGLVFGLLVAAIGLVSSAPIWLALGGAVAIFLLTVGGGYLAGKSNYNEEIKRLVVNCPKTPSGAMDLVLGNFEGHVSYNNGVPYNLDLKVPGKPETTYLLEQDRNHLDDSGNPKLRVSGIQVTGQAAHVPPGRELTVAEKSLVEELHNLTAVCSHPEITAKFQDLLGKAQQKLNERAPGSYGAYPSRNDYSNQAN